MAVGKRRLDWSGRAAMRSPGRPPVARREERRRFWGAIAAGLASEEAAAVSGVSQAVGTRWFREAGGMPPATFAPFAKPLSGRYLSFAEREEIALLRIQGCGVREVARRLGRAASTVSRELRRNAATRSGGLGYRATTGQWHSDRSARRPKPAKLTMNAALREYVQDRLAGMISATRRRSRCRSGRAMERAAGTGLGRTDDGPGPGARSGSPAACGSTSRTMRPCASATRPSISRSTSKAEEPCAAS